MKITYDAEFLEDGRTIELISLGMAAEDGRELYAVNADMDQAAVRADPWLRRNVWPQLPLTKNPKGTRGMDALDTHHPDVRPRAQIVRLVEDFLKATPDLELWAYYASYDHVTLAQLWGRMADLPAYVPMRTNDIAQEHTRQGSPPFPEQPAGHHNALADARHNLSLMRVLGLIKEPTP